MSDPFAVEGAETSYITVCHLDEGHRYTFLVVDGIDGERAFSESVLMREDLRARRRGADYVTAARAFAEREARAAGLIE
jgi:hypothetical protein